MAEDKNKLKDEQLNDEQLDDVTGGGRYPFMFMGNEVDPHLQ